MSQVAAVIALCVTLVTAIGGVASAADTVAMSGDHFNEAGYRSEHYRSTTPQTLPGGRVLSLEELQAVRAEPGVVLFDVLSAGDVEPDPFDGSWLIDDLHKNIPGSVWLPNVGRGYLEESLSAYFRQQLEDLSEAKLDAHLIFYCVEDCWMAWNAAKRAMALGYTNVSWFRRGMTAWEEASLPVETASPVPVPVE